MDLDIQPVLEHYGWEPRSGSGWFTTRCPFHDDRNGSFRVNLEKNCCICMACPAKGDTIALIMWKESCDFATALSFYANLTGRSDIEVRSSDDRGGSAVPSRARSHERNSGVLSSRIRRRPFGGA